MQISIKFVLFPCQKWALICIQMVKNVHRNEQNYIFESLLFLDISNTMSVLFQHRITVKS